LNSGLLYRPHQSRQSNASYVGNYAVFEAPSIYMHCLAHPLQNQGSLSLYKTEMNKQFSKNANIVSISTVVINILY